MVVLQWVKVWIAIALFALLQQKAGRVIPILVNAYPA
jgi:hypothetical protein